MEEVEIITCARDDLYYRILALIPSPMRQNDKQSQRRAYVILSCWEMKLDTPGAERMH